MENPSLKDIEEVKKDFTIANKKLSSVKNEINNLVYGQNHVIDQILISILAEGHALIIGLPGLAKTRIVSFLSIILGFATKRVQFTPDLMPSDILGSEILEENAKSGKDFRFIEGPIFSQLLLADEINRASPRTQSALLQAMQEKKVTITGNTYDLPKPFHVLATQNPIDQEGTYPLPEAQLDRFMFHLNVGYPSIEEEVSIVNKTTIGKQEIVNKVFTKESIINFQELTLRVPISENVVTYAVKLASSTRPNEETSDSFVKQWVEWGAGPRASQFLALGAKAKALLDGRPTPSIEDVQLLAPDILRHRVLPNFNAEAEGIKVDDIVEHLIKSIEA